MGQGAAGFLLVALVVSPGFAYRVARERVRPSRQRGGFADTASLLVVGVLATAVAISLFALTRAAMPMHTPDVGRLLSESAYWKAHLPYVSAWAAAVYLCSLGFALAAGRYLPNLTGGIAQVSTWWTIFVDDLPRDRDALKRRRQQRPRKHDNTHVPYVECSLADGTAYRGLVYSFNTQFEESASRDLVLRSPIWRRPASSDNVHRETAPVSWSAADWEELEGFGYLVVNASQIVSMQVAHVPRTELAHMASAEEAEAP